MTSTPLNIFRTPDAIISNGAYNTSIEFLQLCFRSFISSPHCEALEVPLGTLEFVTPRSTPPNFTIEDGRINFVEDFLIRFVGVTMKASAMAELCNPTATMDTLTELFRDTPNVAIIHRTINEDNNKYWVGRTTATGKRKTKTAQAKNFTNHGEAYDYFEGIIEENTARIVAALGRAEDQFTRGWLEGIISTNKQLLNSSSFLAGTFVRTPTLARPITFDLLDENGVMWTFSIEAERQYVHSDESGMSDESFFSHFLMFMSAPTGEAWNFGDGAFEFVTPREAPPSLVTSEGYYPRFEGNPSVRVQGSTIEVNTLAQLAHPDSSLKALMSLFGTLVSAEG